MGFRSDGTCTKCGNETNQHDYVCDTCYRFDQIEEFRKQYPVARNIQAEDIEKFMKLENGNKAFIKSIHECVAQKKWAQIIIIAGYLKDNEEQIANFKDRLETYKLELTYDEIKTLSGALHNGNPLKDKINKVLS